MPWWNRRRLWREPNKSPPDYAGEKEAACEAYFLRRPLRRTIKPVSQTGFSQTLRKFAKRKNLCPLAASRPSNWAPRRHSGGKNCAHFFLFFFCFSFYLRANWKCFNPFFFSDHRISANMKHQLLVVLLCVSCGASVLGTSIPAVSTLNFTDFGAAHGYGTDAAAKIRKRRYISQNDMSAILDYHNKVRGRVFPPASNMEYMVSGSPAGMNDVFMCAQRDNWCTDCAASDHQSSHVRKVEEVMCITWSVVGDTSGQFLTPIKLNLQYIFSAFLLNATITKSALIHLCTSHN